MTLNVPIYSVCTPWATGDDLFGPCAGGDVPEPLLSNCLRAASDILFGLSGRQFPGVCQDTVYPEARFIQADYGRPIRGGEYEYGYYNDAAGSATGIGLCNRSADTPCTAVPEVGLGLYPLIGIEQVVIDGAVVDPSTYAISNNRTLIRVSTDTGINDGWPCCNDPTLANDQPGTWYVTAIYGTPPPPLGVMAAAEMACELIKLESINAADSCSLPVNVASISRQGITAVVTQVSEIMAKGFTGLRICDRFLATVNPQQIQRRATVWTPDIGRRVRRAG